MDYSKSVSEAASILGISVQAVHKRIRSGSLDARKINKRWLVSESSIAHALEHAPRAGRPRKSTAYTLMNGPYRVMDFQFNQASGQFAPGAIYDAARAPIGTITNQGRGRASGLRDWWEHRSIPGSREGIDAKLTELGVQEASLIPFRNLGLSLSDQYWVRPTESDLDWHDLNYFENDFGAEGDFGSTRRSQVDLSSPDNTSEGALPINYSENGFGPENDFGPECGSRGTRRSLVSLSSPSTSDGTLPISHFENDLEPEGPEGGSWDTWLSQVGLSSPDNTSEGALPKRWVIDKGQRVLLKGHIPWTDQQVYNEAVATALHRRILGANEFVPYSIRTLGGLGPVSACSCFITQDEEYVPASLVYDDEGKRTYESVFDAVIRQAANLGIPERDSRAFLAKMIVCDSLLANSDRHLRNFGYIRNIHTLEWRFAPLFDSGNCLWYDKDESAVARGDYSFVSRPFDASPGQQLALAASHAWFELDLLDGFADEALELLEHGNLSRWRLDYLRTGLELRMTALRLLWE